MRVSMLGFIAVSVVSIMAGPVHAADRDDEYHLVFSQDRQFQPGNLEIPPGKRIRLIVENQSGVPAEFESFELNREKIVVPHGRIIIYLGPLDPGVYNYFNDFDRNTKGTITVNEQSTM